MDYKVFIVGLIGTTVMSIYSLKFSPLVDNDYTEPKLLYLSILFKLNERNLNRNYRWYGWLLQFLIGILYAFLLHFLLNTFALDRSLLTGFLFGLLLGILSNCAWTILFYTNREFLMTYNIYFFIHILLSHIVFGIIAISVYMFFNW